MHSQKVCDKLIQTEKVKEAIKSMLYRFDKRSLKHVHEEPRMSHTGEI